jgi:hypothetical protein
MAYIRQIDEIEATGVLKRIYEGAKSRAGKVANIIKIMSLDERTTQSSIQFYVSLMKTPNALDAACREMLASVVSNANGCFY